MLDDRAKRFGHARPVGAVELELATQLGERGPQPLVVLLDELEAAADSVAVLDVGGDETADQILAFLEPPVDPLSILQTLHALHACCPPLAGWFVHDGAAGQPDDRDALKRTKLHRVCCAALGRWTMGRTGRRVPAASVEDDVGPRVSGEPGLEIVVEPLLGGGNDDEVGHAVWLSTGLVSGPLLQILWPERTLTTRCGVGKRNSPDEIRWAARLAGPIAEQRVDRAHHLMHVERFRE